MQSRAGAVPHAASQERLRGMALDRWPEIVVAGVVVGAVAAIVAVVAAIGLWRARVAEERRFTEWATRGPR
jgi:hypothetical protein